jgi:SAM-dependent methyltransferase
MGITSFSVELLNKVIEEYSPKNVCELGAQNLYNQPLLPAPYANEFYEPLGIDYTCIDLSNENGALNFNLSRPIPEIWYNKFDLVTNFGTSEHVSDLYECFKNIHNLCKKGGIVICENPKQGNWPGHGFHYLTEEFYSHLALLCRYTLIEWGEQPAMGNIIDGWNIYAIYQIKNGEFCTREEFETLEYYEE